MITITNAQSLEQAVSYLFWILLLYRATIEHPSLNPHLRFITKDFLNYLIRDNEAIITFYNHSIS